MPEVKVQPVGPTVIPPPQPPELFPGFGKEYEQLKVEEYKATRRLEEAGVAKAKLGPTGLPPYIARLIGFEPPAAGPWFGREPYAERMEAAQALAQQEYDAALVAINSIRWRQEIMADLPNYLALPTYKIQNANDILKYIAPVSMSTEDTTWLTNIYDRLKHLTNTIPEDFTGDALEVQSKILNEILTSPKLELKAVHNLTVDEIAKSFAFGVAELPKGLTADKVREMLGQIDIVTADMKSAEAYLAERAKAWALETDRINLIRSGLVLVEAPQLTPIEFGKLLLTQPMMATSMELEKYFNILPRPLASAAIIGAHRLFNTPEDIAAGRLEELYTYYRSMGETGWSAYAKAFDDWDLSLKLRVFKWDIGDAGGLLKMGIEAAFDPTTYIGLGFGVAAAGKLGGVPRALRMVNKGTRIGNLLMDFETGYMAGADAIFKATIMAPARFIGGEVILAPFKLVGLGLGHGWERGIPRTATQAARNYGNKGFMGLRATFIRAHPDLTNTVGSTAKDWNDLVANNIDQVLARPTEGWDLAVSSGADLLEFNYLDDVAARKMIEPVTEMAELTTGQLAHFNSELANMFSTQGERVTAGKILSQLGFEASEDSVEKLSSKLSAFKQKVADEAKKALHIDDPDDILKQVTTYLTDKRYDNLRSPLSEYMTQAGRTTSWVSRVADNFLYSSQLVWLERRAVMPLARWNLLFANFGPFNYGENMMRGALGGGELQYPSGYFPDHTINALGDLSNFPYETIMAQRGEQRLAQAMVDPKTGRSAIFRDGKIPFVTKDLTIPEKIPFLGGKTIGKTINIGGQDFYIGSFQDAYDMWSHFNNFQNTYDIHTHFFKAMDEMFPEESRAIRAVAAEHKSKLDAVKFLSKRDAADIDRTVTEVAFRSPEAVRAIADIDVLTMERRLINKELGKVMSSATEVERTIKKGISDEVLNGSMFSTGIDSRMDAWVQASRDLQIASLKPQIDALKGEVDSIISAPAKNALYHGTYSADVAGKIRREGFQLGKSQYGFKGGTFGEGVYFYNNKTEYELAKGYYPYENLVTATLKPETRIKHIDLASFDIGERAADVRKLVAEAKSEGYGGVELTFSNIKELSERQRFKIWAGDQTIVFDPSNVVVGAPAKTLSDVLGDMQSLTAMVDASDAQMAYYRRLTALRAKKLTPGKNVDDFNIGSSKLLTEYAETTETEIERLISYIDEVARATPLNETQLSRLSDLESVERLRLKSIQEVRLRNVDIDAKVAKTPRNKRNERFWQQQNALKALSWDTHFAEIKPLKSADLMARRNFLTSVDKPTFVPDQIPEVVGQLAPQHLAYLFGSTGDDLYRGLTKVQRYTTVFPREDFVIYAREQANTYAAKFGKTADDLGFTDEGIGEVYDQLWRNLGVEPSILTPDSPTVMQLEEVRQSLHRLYAANKIPESDIVKYRQYINSVADDMERLPQYRQPVAGKAAAAQIPAGAPDWLNKKEQAMSKARELHALAFPTYDDANIIDEGMRAIFPFFNYELFRWRWIPRTFMRTPGTLTGLARYENYTDSGYMPVPGTDLQMNILRGSIWMGGLRSLYLKDFPEYYDSIPGMEFLDYISRFGFYPGAAAMLPITLFGQKTGRPELLAELAPPFVNTGLSALRALSPEHIGKVLDVIYPDRFRDYQTMLTLASEGEDADEIWRKKKAGDKLEPEEEKLWLKAENRVDGIKGILMQQTGLFRIRPPEYSQLRQEMRLAVEEATGVPVAVQEQIDRQYPVTGKRFSDIYPLDILQSKLLYEFDTYRRWQGISTPLQPAGQQMLEVKIADYYDTVEKEYDKARRTGLYEDDKLVRPSIVELNRQLVAGEIGPDQWRAARSDIVGGLAEAVRVLHESPAYKDVPVTFEERAAYLAEKGVVAPTLRPDQELLYYYYELQPEYKFDWESQRMERDFDTYYANIDILLESMDTAHRERLLARIQSDWTPMEKLYWQASRDYLRPYRNLRSVVLNEYSDEERQLIRRYEVAAGTEREELQSVVGPDGEKLIAGFTRRLREARQRLRILDSATDAWLSFFGVTTSLLSTPAKLAYEELRKQYLVEGMIE